MLRLLPGEDLREVLQRVLRSLPGHGGLPGAAFRVVPRRGSRLAHGHGSDPGSSNEHLGGLDVDGSGLAIREFEVGEVGIETRRAEKRWCWRRCSGDVGGGERTGTVCDGGAADAHEAVVGREGRVVVEFEAERAEEARVLLEDAVGAVAAGVGAVADVVDGQR